MPIARKRQEKDRTPPTTPEDGANGKRRANRKFSPATKKIREQVLDATAAEGIEAKSKNKGKNGQPRLPSKWLKNKVATLAKSCGLLQITIDDIRNRISAKEKEKKKKDEASEQPPLHPPPPTTTTTARSSLSNNATHLQSQSTGQVTIGSDTTPSEMSSLSSTSKEASDSKRVDNGQAKDNARDVSSNDSPNVTSQDSSDTPCDLIPQQLAPSMGEEASSQASSGPPSASASLVEASALTSDSSPAPSLPQRTTAYLLDFEDKVTEDDTSELVYALRSASCKNQSAEIIIEHHSRDDLSISQGSFSRLRLDGLWLDDDILDFVLQGILAYETSGCFFFKTRFMAYLLQGDVYSYDSASLYHEETSTDIKSIVDSEMLFVPIHTNNGTHYNFLMVDMKRKQIKLWEPFGKLSSNQGYLHAMRRYLYDVSVSYFGKEATGTLAKWNDQWSVYDSSDGWPRQQKETGDCAIRIILGIQRLAHGLELSPTTFTQEDISAHQIRMRLALLLWDHHLPVACKSKYDTATMNPPQLVAPRQEQESLPNKGGRPKGSTNAQKLVDQRAEKDATNWVVKAYAEQKRIKEEENKQSEKRVRVAAGFREQLVKEAKTRFQLEGDKFDVPLQTIESRIKAERLEVYQPGEVSPVLEVEVTLVAIIIMAGQLKSPLSRGDIIDLMNSLIEGTRYEEGVIEWKRRRRMDVNSSQLLGDAWYEGFMKRNEQLLDDQRGQKYAKSREEQCNYQSFEKMYNNVQKGLIDSGNATLLDTPVHMDTNGNVVEDISEAHGLPVTLKLTRPENIFGIDETGSNSNGMADKPKGGEKKVVANGQKAQEVTSTKDCHFTVVPVTNFLAELVLVTIIFPGETFHASWGIGEDPFMIDIPGEDQAASVGPGKRYPGLSVLTVNGKEVPIFFAASPSASMTSEILMGMFAKMDELGITKRGVDEAGKPYFPYILLDGHVSRFGIVFLEYVNDPVTRWHPQLGVPYGTNIWQLHDDTRMNGTFKMQLYDTKSKFITKKRQYGLPAEIRKTEIVIIVREAIEASFNDIEKSKRALAVRGWNPFTRATLDDPDILISAPPEVQEQRRAILALRGISGSVAGGARSVVTSQTNLLSEGSGRILASALTREDAMGRVASATGGLNWQCATAQTILDLARNVDARQVGRAQKEAEENNRATIREQYHDPSKRLTSGLVFNAGEGVLNKDLLDATRARISANDAAAEAKASRKKKKDLAAKENVQRLREEIQKDFPPAVSERDLNDTQLNSLTVKKLTTLVQYKKTRKDGKCPTNKADYLIKMLRNTWSRTSPNPSPCNSDEEEDDDDGNSSSASRSGDDNAQQGEE